MVFGFLKGFASRPEAETKSVILLRQVPIRLEEPARSWLGGLPQMPEGVAWPRTEDGAPLQFVAQVCCADLPKEMWGGIGPREGWLLLFVECYSMEDENYGGNVQVLHVGRLGPEREPPEDMGTYRHAMVDYIDYGSPVIRPGIPKMWRRWPVDLVVQEVPPPSDEDGRLVWAPLPVDPEALYGGPVKREYLRLKVTDESRPLTRRGLVHFLDATQKGMDSDLYAARKRAPVKLNIEPGFVASVLDATRATLDKARAQLVENDARLDAIKTTMPEDQEKVVADILDSSRRQRDILAYQEARLAYLVPLDGPDAEAALAAEVQRARNRHWDVMQAQERLIADLRADVLTQDLDAILPADQFNAVVAKLSKARSETWTVDNRQKSLWKVEAEIFGPHRIKQAMEFALRENVLDLYTRDAAGRAMIPPELLAELEPLVRDIGCGDAPHRMGGPCDAVQWEDAPSDSVLLFQIFSDYPMGWMWGDVGALYVTLPKRHLKTGVFETLKAELVGH